MLVLVKGFVLEGVVVVGGLVCVDVVVI